jgi:glycosyltransferase involved in cell wall biosynthesis/GT2 family glycosyltransferase
MAKILHISKYYYPFFGGIEDVAKSIIEELKPFHNQMVICFNHHKGNEKSIENDIPVIRVGTITTIASQPVSFEYRKQLKNTIEEFKPDYIHLHLPNPLISIYLLNIDLHGAKLITHWHSDIIGKKMIYRIYSFYEKNILRISDKILATSEIYRQSSKPLHNFAHKTIILQNTVNENKFSQKKCNENCINAIRQKYNNKKIILFVGRHIPYKGIDYLIDAEKLIDRNCVIVIAGRGQKTRKLKKKSQNSNRIFFVGCLSDDDLKNYMCASTVFAFPSYTRGEAFGVVLAEALYCGLPAVSFDIEGSGTTWVNKNNFSGFVVQNRDVKQFANAINRIISNQSLYSQMSDNAKNWVKKNFLKDRITDVLNAVYKTENSEEKSLINVSIVLYNNKLEKVISLIETLKKSRAVNKIFLIDNSPKKQQGFENLDVIYIFNNKNFGYGRGHNIAFKQTLCDKDAAYHLAINADIAFEPQILENIVDYMQENQDVGSLMPKVFYPSGKIQYLCRLLPDPIDLIVRRFLPKSVMKNRIKRLEMRNTDYNHIINVPHISGCFMFLRVSVLEKAGLFDKRYFLYLEDVDLTRRIRQIARTVFYPKVSIMHEHRQGSYNSFRLLIIHIISAIRYFNKWGWFKDNERKKINLQTISEVKIIEN